MTLDTKIKSLGRLDSRDRRNIAVIDGFLKPAFCGASLEPGTPPACHRLVGHISVDVHPGHQTAAEAEAASYCVVVNLVLGRLRGVEGFDPIGAERDSGHGLSSLLRAQACT